MTVLAERVEAQGPLAEDVRRWVQGARRMGGHTEESALVTGILWALSKVPSNFLRDRIAVREAVIRCVAADVNPLDGDAYFFPARGRLTFALSHKGLLKIAARSGAIKNLSSQCVYEGDTFSVSFFPPKLTHEMGTGPRAPEKITHVWAIAHLSNGHTEIEVLDRVQLGAIMAKSPSSELENSVWALNFAEMARAKVTKRLLQRLALISAEEGEAE